MKRLLLSPVACGLTLMLGLASAVGLQAEELVPPGARLETLWEEGEFTEGCEVAVDGTVYFSDIPQSGNGRVLRFDPQSKQTTVYSADSRKSNGLCFDKAGRLLAACGANDGAQALCVVNPNGRVVPLADSFDGKKFNAPNDLDVHPQGWVYFSDPRYVGAEPIELDQMSVYRYDPKTKATVRATTDISKPNGVAVAPDGQTLYVAETNNGTPGDGKKRMTLNAFPILEDGSLGDKRVLVDFGEATGIDGMTLDSQGRIYGAVRSDGAFGIRIYSPTGQELARIATPDLPTNCCFGVGTEAQVLYVTAGKGLYRIGLNATGHHLVGRQAAGAARRPGRDAFAAVTDEPGLPRVLLIGDSISIGYTLAVRDLLKGQANVHRIPENGGPTTNGLAKLDKWLGPGNWDVIHFNWGLHDLKHMNEKGDIVAVGQGRQQVLVDDYEKNLATLVERLQKTGATLVWCATTPVPEGAQGRVPSDAVKYNTTARRVMESRQIQINDLYSFANERLAGIQQPKRPFTDPGSQVLAEQVVSEIKAALKSRTGK